MALIKPSRLLKQYHPKSAVSLGAIWTLWTRLNARVVQAMQLIGYDKGANIMPRCGHDLRGRQLVLGQNIHGAPGTLLPLPQSQGLAPQENDPSLKVEGPSWDEELVYAPSEDKRLDDPSEEEEDVPPEMELVLVEATSAPSFDELRAEHGLP
ncbi:LOW QUALITY PROTEIN: hypothetical protein Cgig2_028169 [Carnegiea gigantea]|uniref:Uncharacterized protein n=1 Tax=Carnegiea gigantea TaxID=171969 RepID=A0A9Q1GWR3_9CARY|nr:LOW QUALITY PROTEIN: hypothetical protein Cgig2_028169 [Carnegiea gigantea]